MQFHSAWRGRDLNQLNATTNAAGGGGGAGSKGYNAYSVVGGNGGDGVTSTISGSSVTYAGGGGGSGPSWGYGGTGGGGNGINTNGNASSGTGGLGGGGGGHRGGGAGNSGAGGSGIVIIAVNLNFFHLKKPPFIIEMAENGILDYQGMNQAIYRGATSNIIVDTQSMSIEIGAGNSSHTSNLHIECDHAANVASIQLNSNVVTEFSRSKKLIKYPRVAMTGQTTSNHTITGSSWYGSSALGGSGTQYEPWKAFDNVGNHTTGQLAWYSFDYSAPKAYSGTDDAFNPSHGGTATPVLFTGAVQGEWLKIQLPHKVALDHYIMYGPNQEREFPRDWTVYGSVDGTNWNWIDSRIAQIFGDGTGSNGTATGKKKEFQFDTPTNEYLYFAFVFTRGPVDRDSYIGIGEIELYGVPEYDPDAHGTDVTVKSVANVPNTDWLEVYYDGQDYTDMPATVDNKTGVSTYDATPNGGVGFDATQKAFTFDAASSQYLSSSTPVDGNYIHSISIWFKGTNLTPAAGDTLMWIGDNVNNERIEIYLESDKINYSFKTNDVVADIPLLNNRWYHLTVTYNGVAGVSGREIYLDGVKQPTTHTGNSAVLAVDNNTLNLGGFSGTSTTYMFSGSIANFRLFNRALTSDEIYQLYAYQKGVFRAWGLVHDPKGGAFGDWNIGASGGFGCARSNYQRV